MGRGENNTTWLKPKHGGTWWGEYSGLGLFLFLWTRTPAQNWLQSDQRCTPPLFRDMLLSLVWILCWPGLTLQQDDEAKHTSKLWRNDYKTRCFPHIHLFVAVRHNVNIGCHILIFFIFGAAHPVLTHSRQRICHWIAWCFVVSW